MFVGTALSVRLLVYAGLSLFIISGPYLYVVVCVLYAYNLTVGLETYLQHFQIIVPMLTTYLKTYKPILY